jgi:hypothetical protein
LTCSYPRLLASCGSKSTVKRQECDLLLWKICIPAIGKNQCFAIKAKVVKYQIFAYSGNFEYSFHSTAQKCSKFNGMGVRGLLKTLFEVERNMQDI